MRKSALLIAAALLAFSLPMTASAATKRSLVGDALHQLVVPFESLTAKKAAPAKKVKKAKKKKVAKKAKKAAPKKKK